MNVGNYLVELLAINGVTKIFGVPGGQAAPFYSALEVDGRIDYVGMRDERNAVYAADGYARASGRIAAVDATVGPGTAKLPSGLLEALNSSIPVLALVTDVGRESRHLASSGHASQGLDQAALLAPVVKAFRRVEVAEGLPEIVRFSLETALSGRPGPVAIEVAEDLMRSTTELEMVQPKIGPDFPLNRYNAPGESVMTLARGLASAKRPLIVAGGGVLSSGASDVLVAVADRVGAAVATTPTGKGAVVSDHPLSVGVLGSGGVRGLRELCTNADYVLLVGFKCGQSSTWNWRFPTVDQHVARIDIDPEAYMPLSAPDMVLTGDATTVLNELQNRISDVGADISVDPNWQRQIADMRKSWFDSRKGEEAGRQTPLSPQRIVSELRATCGHTDVLVCDASFASAWGARHFDVQTSGRRFVAPRGTGGLGYGLGAAVGVALANPGARVWVLVGDGAMCYSLGELSTVAHLGLPIGIVVLNNRSYAWIKWWQERSEKHGYRIADLPPMDFAAVAAGMGIEAVRTVHEPDDLTAGFRACSGEPGPFLLDVRSDPWASPLGQPSRPTSAVEQTTYLG